MWFGFHAKECDKVLINKLSYSAQVTHGNELSYKPIEFSNNNTVFGETHDHSDMWTKKDILCQ